MYYRIFAFITCLASWVLHLVNFGLPDALKFGATLTQWGQFLTTLSFGTSLTFYRDPSKQKYKNKHSCCQGWKFHILAFEIVFLSEMVIMVFFWAVIFVVYSRMAQEANLSIDDVPRRLIIQSVFNHLGLGVLLLIEYICFSATPWAPRHFWIILVFSTAYMIVNLTVSLTKKPVYPVITWSDPVGIIVPLLMMAGALGLHFLIHYCNNCKLRKLGHTRYVDFIKGYH